MIDQKTAKSIASKLDGWLQSACYELAGGPDNIDEAERAYEDPLTLQDLIADRMCDESENDDDNFEMIAIALHEIAHPPLQKAIENILDRHQ